MTILELDWNSRVFVVCVMYREVVPCDIVGVSKWVRASPDAFRRSFARRWGLALYSTCNYNLSYIRFVIRVLAHWVKAYTCPEMRARIIWIFRKCDRQRAWKSLEEFSIWKKWVSGYDETVNLVDETMNS